jgi:hypothetical protein
VFSVRWELNIHDGRTWILALVTAPFGLLRVTAVLEEFPASIFNPEGGSSILAGGGATLVTTHTT